jgi:hypothetical protein
MFNTAILDVAIGMIFVYLLLSLMCSAANEMIELWLKNRASDLEKGLRELLQDPSGNGLVKKVYDHPLISGLYKGVYDPATKGQIKRLLGRVNLPSYIPARTFALALLDTTLPAEADTAGGTARATPTTTPEPQETRDAFDKLRTNISTLGNAEVEKALMALVDAADKDVSKARENIEKWFDSSMDRVSGWYKRRSQVIVFVIGLFVTIGVNADSVLVAKRLSADKSLRESLVSAAQDYAKKDADQAAAPTHTASPSSSPADQTAKPKASPTPATATAAASPKPSPVATASPSPIASPSATPQSAATAENGNTDCEHKPEDPQCRFRESLDEIKSLSLPLGWDSSIEGQQWPGLHFWEKTFYSNWVAQFRVHALGWLLTALAISLGAPFWFDMLNKFIVIRSTVKPKEKSPEEKSKD